MNTVKILYLNARSLFKKLDDLAEVMDFYKPTIVIVCETWLNNKTTNAMLSIPGYYIQNELRIDRQDTRHGAGGGL